MPANTANRTFSQHMVLLLKTQQFYWFVFHLFTLITFGLSFLESFSGGISFYRYCLISIIITYIIVIKQIYFKNRNAIKNITFNKMVRDENVQYFGLSIWFYFISFRFGKITGGLFSFNIYSVFHVLTYFQNNLLHQFPIAIQTEQRINALINQFTTKFNQVALMAAANSEIFILLNLILTTPLLLFKAFRLDVVYISYHLLTVLLISVFIYFRFNQNPATKTIIVNYDNKVESVLAMPQLQQYLHVYRALKSQVITQLLPLARFTRSK